MKEDGEIGAVPFGKLLTRSEVAEILRITTRSLDTLIRSGALRARKIGSRVRIASEDLVSYLNRPAA